MVKEREVKKKFIFERNTGGFEPPQIVLSNI